MAKGVNLNLGLERTKVSHFHRIRALSGSKSGRQTHPPMRLGDAEETSVQHIHIIAPAMGMTAYVTLMATVFIF